MERDRLALSVVASGSPPLIYQWYKDGSPIPGATNRVYAVDAVTICESGDYQVEVSNECGAALSQVVSVRVQAESPPRIRIAIVNGNVVITHNQCTPVYIQETSALTPDPADTVWTSLPDGPHPSPVHAGPAVGAKFFRFVQLP
jgi:hypothetical protein